MKKNVDNYKSRLLEMQTFTHRCAQVALIFSIFRFLGAKITCWKVMEARDTTNVRAMLNRLF